jgi:hypothetical protein
MVTKLSSLSSSTPLGCVATKTYQTKEMVNEWLSITTIAVQKKCAAMQCRIGDVPCLQMEEKVPTIHLDSSRTDL